MQPHESAPASASPKAAKSSTMRYVISLAVLVAIVMGIAWVIQNLPNIRPKNNAPPVVDAKQILSFKRQIAQFGPDLPNPGDKDSPENIVPNEVELGTSGHYDFPFKNVWSADVDILAFASSCDCNSVKAAALDAGEWQAATAHQDAK